MDCHIIYCLTSVAHHNEQTPSVLYQIFHQFLKEFGFSILDNMFEDFFIAMMRQNAFLSLLMNIVRIRDKLPQVSGNMQTHLLVNIGQLGLKMDRRVVKIYLVFLDGAAAQEEESERGRRTKR